jgi:hypothetical protein
MHTLKYLLVVAAFLPLTGCDQVFTREPAGGDLAGTYRLTADSKTFLVKQKNYKSVPESVIELRSDSSVVIGDLPDCATIDGFGKTHGCFVSGHGTWKLEKAFIGYGLSLDISKGGTLQEGIYTGPWIAVRRRLPPYLLEITIGDPDSGESITYQRDSIN